MRFRLSERPSSQWFRSGAQVSFLWCRSERWNIGVGDPMWIEILWRNSNRIGYKQSAVQVQGLGFPFAGFGCRVYGFPMRLRLSERTSSQWFR